MTTVVIDTNVLLVAEGQHEDISDTCRKACTNSLTTIRENNVVVLDDGYRILNEYQNKIDTKRGKGVGAAFLKWLFQNLANPRHVQQVHVNESKADQFKEFPLTALESQFDRSDRKFPAVANAHPAKPPILQAADCKWLDWWKTLEAAGIRVEFVCLDDVKRFYEKKFPSKQKPIHPQ